MSKLEHEHIVKVVDDPAFAERCNRIAREMALHLPKEGTSDNIDLVFGVIGSLTQVAFSKLIKLGYRTRSFEEWAFHTRRMIERQERADQKAAKEAKL